jgi:hypothetical protein
VVVVCTRCASAGSLGTAGAACLLCFFAIGFFPGAAGLVLNTKVGWTLVNPPRATRCWWSGINSKFPDFSSMINCCSSRGWHHSVDTLCAEHPVAHHTHYHVVASVC